MNPEYLDYLEKAMDKQAKGASAFDKSCENMLAQLVDFHPEDL